MPAPEADHRPPAAVTAEPPVCGLVVAVLVGLAGAFFGLAGW